MCVLSEIGRFLSYNALADGEDCNVEEENDERGAEAVLRIFHGTKTGKHSTLSFESAKSLLGRGEPVVIGWSLKQLTSST